MKNHYLFSLLFLLFVACSSLLAQDRSLSGTVKDNASGEALVGVNVVALQTGGQTLGTITDIEGKFALKVPQGVKELTFSYVGYQSLTLPIGDQSVMEVGMQLDVRALDEIVVTAFGVEKQEKALAYAVTEVSGRSFVQAREANPVNSLAGKIAGVQVTRPSSGVGGSSRVTIRGVRSLTGNNQPLYVVDNIPVDNQNIDAAGRWGGIDYGDGTGDLNPDDIESMSVLKGPNAAALYGARAANGVILITTKKGQKNNGIGIEYNGNATFDNALVLPAVQNEYGAGRGGKILTNITDVLSLSSQNSGTSWGAKMQGQSALSWDGTNKAYSAQPDNIKNFYQTGSTFTNSLALSGANDKAHFRLSYTNLTNKGIIPTSTFDRNMLTLRGGVNLTDKLTMDAKVSYIKTNAYNRPNLADIMDNPANSLMWMPRNTSISDLENYKDQNGAMRFYSSETFLLNPYWAVNENINQDEKNRLLGFVSLKYQITDWLSAEGRYGKDWYSSDRYTQVAKGTRYRPNGMLTQNNYTVNENNAYFMLNANKQINADLKIGGMLGAWYTRNDYKQVGYSGFNLSVPNLYTIQNAVDRTPNYNVVQKEMQSVFAQANFDYKNTFFLDLTARNDWSSTLPTNANSFFYPSVSGSYVFSETLQLPENILTFGKIRASWASVGNDTDPYRLAPTYSLAWSGTHLGQPLGTVGSMAYQDYPNYAVPLANMKPEQTTGIEIGLDLRFLNDRVGLDVAYYQTSTKNQILPTTISATSGFLAATINAGEMENTGFEIMLRATPVKLANGFQWDVNFNFARNRNKVISLLGKDESGKERLEQLQLGADRAVFVQARPGNPYGDLAGIGYKKDANGNRIFGANGMPIPSEGVQVLGNVMPNWIGGITNTFTYKDFAFTAVIDIRNGGKIFSQSARYMHLNGNHENTLQGREAFYAGSGGFVGAGVSEGGATNTVAVDPEKYWKSVYDNNIIEDFIYDASFIKLREINLTYTLPTTWLSKTPIKGATFAFVGRNLMFFQNGVKGFDPEANYNAGNGQGIESGSIPTFRSWGFNLNLKF